MKRILTGAAVALAAMSGLTVQSFAATVDLPPVFDSISPILVYFRTLTIGDVQKIIDLELNDIFSRIKDLGYHIEISTEAKERLATMGYEAR